MILKYRHEGEVHLNIPKIKSSSFYRRVAYAANANDVLGI